MEGHTCGFCLKGYNRSIACTLPPVQNNHFREREGAGNHGIKPANKNNKIQEELRLCEN